MWIFECVETYSEMRAKISKALFCISLIEIFILAQISLDFSNILKMLSFNTETEILGIKIYIAYIYIPLAISILENIFCLHDKIQNIFKIRSSFDKNVIFLEYIKQLKIKTSLSNKELRKLYSKNKNLKDAVSEHFYYHVSSTEPKIDKHYINMALTSWCWVWIVLDTIVFSLVVEIIVIIFKVCNYDVNIWFILCFAIYIAILVVLLVCTLYVECKKCTIVEIKKAVKFDEKQEVANEKNEKLEGIIQNALSNKQCGCKIRKRCPLNKPNK